MNSLKAQRRMQASVDGSYLERSHDELEDHFHFSFKVVGKEGEHEVVCSKQGNQQKGGLGQPPGDRRGADSGDDDRGVGGWAADSWEYHVHPCFCSRSAVPMPSGPPALLAWRAAWGRRKLCSHPSGEGSTMAASSEP